MLVWIRRGVVGMREGNGFRMYVGGRVIDFRELLDVGRVGKEGKVN